MSLRIIPLELKQANELVARWHRHHKPVIGHRFSIGAAAGSEIVGAAIIGRPVARMTDYHSILEVTRLVTNGHKNACSILYAAAARIGREMGYQKIQTFILDEETGTSLAAAGWTFEGHTDPRGGGRWHTREGRRNDQPEGLKRKYSKDLTGGRLAPRRSSAALINALRAAENQSLKAES